MWLIDWFRALGSGKQPKGLTEGQAVAGKQPLYSQFQRIGGGLTPAGVSTILQRADAGQPAQLVDLTNESRQKDGHLHGVLETREAAVALLEHDFVEPPDATPQEKDAANLCRRIRDDFQNMTGLLSHLQGSGTLFGHGTSELKWRKTDDGLLLPYTSEPIHPRRFIFAQDDGSLRFQTGPFDTKGIDLLEEFPGRIVQVRRRITGDVAVREGLCRVLVWAALLRNWDLRDWIALGEVGWKPWRIGSYKAGAHQRDIDDLVARLEQMGASGVLAAPENAEVKVEWPKGAVSGQSTHRELFDALGREISKAVLGQTTSTEAGPNGDRASTQTRDTLRTDRRELDCVADAAALYYHLYIPAVQVNLGTGFRVAPPSFNTDEAVDQVAFSEVVKNLREAGVRTPAAWVRDELGMPTPIEGEELVGDDEPEETDPSNEGGAPDDDAEDDDAEE